jgi:dodecin
MSVASVSEISAESTESFDAAIREGIERATKTLRHVQHAWVGDQEVVLNEGQVQSYRVRLKVTFLLEG